MESTIYILNYRTDKVIRSIDTKYRIASLMWDAEHNWLATGHYARIIDPENPAVDDRVRTESRVQLWDAATGKRVRTLRWGKMAIFALSFTPDGRTLAAGDSHRTGRLVFWDTSTGREFATVVAHPETAESRQRSENSTEALPPLGGVRSIAFSSDGRLLVSGGGDGMVRVWEAATANELCHFDAGRNPIYASDFVYSVAFAPDGNTVASGHERGLALLWNLRRTIAGEKPLSATLNAPQLEACWTDLASPQPLRAYRAIEQLRAASRVSVPFIKDHLHPVPATDARLIARWIGDLDSDDFSVREKATENLRKVTDQAENALRKVLASRPSLEARRRINEILSALEKSRTSAARLRAVRTLCALERIGTPEAREVIESLAKKDSRPWLTQDAESALRRLKASAAPRP